MANLPETVVDCDGCGKEMNLLSPHLNMQLKPKQGALLLSETAAEEGEIPLQVVSLGTRSGRGVLKRFHNFDCMGEWVSEREGLEPKLEYNVGDGEAYVPEDNRSPEELVEAGEMSDEMLAVIDTTPAEGGE